MSALTLQRGVRTLRMLDLQRMLVARRHLQFTVKPGGSLALVEATSLATIAVETLKFESPTTARLWNNLNAYQGQRPKKFFHSPATDDR